MLTAEKQNKKNVFSGRILEIEGLPDLKVEQAFELTDASAERSCAGCTIKLSVETISEYLRSNIALLKNMIARGYHDPRTMLRRVAKMEEWLANPVLLEGDVDAEYAEIIEIDLNEIKEPIVAAPNDPDNVKLLSEVANDPVQEVFVGSCMTNIGHYRATAKVLEGAGEVKTRLWIAPPTRMDEHQLKEEGVYSVLGLRVLEQKCQDAVCAWEIRRELLMVQQYFLPLPATLIIVWVKMRECILVQQN